MKLIAVEGTPEEIAKLEELTDLLKGRTAAAGAVDHKSRTELPREIANYLSERGGPAIRTYVEEFVKEAVNRGTVPSLGHSKREADGRTPYLMLHDQGPKWFGAAAYVRPGNGNVTFRLLAAEAKGYRYAYSVREGRKNYQYQVALQLRSPEAVREAIELLEKALERIRNSKVVLKTIEHGLSKGRAMRTNQEGNN